VLLLLSISFRQFSIVASHRGMNWQLVIKSGRAESSHSNFVSHA